AGEDLADVLRALRRAIDGEERRGGGDDVDDADLRFLRDAARPASRRGEERRGGEGEREGMTVRREGLGRMSGDEGEGGPEGRDLREREVDEDHVALEDLQPEVGVDANQGDAGERGKREEFDHRVML